jgi:hypothetical protein
MLQEVCIALFHVLLTSPESFQMLESKHDIFARSQERSTQNCHYDRTIVRRRKRGS